MTNAYNTIQIKGESRYEEDFASGICRPGELIKLDTNHKVLRHATQGGDAEAMFAIEDSLQGHDIDTAFAVDDLVPYVIAKKGDVIFAYIDTGETVVKDAFLQSAGNGCLEVRTSTNKALAVAEDAIVTTATGAVSTRICVRVL